MSACAGLLSHALIRTPARAFGQVAGHGQHVWLRSPWLSGKLRNMGRNDDAPESRRQIARRETRKAGDRSADLAKKLMLITDAQLGKLDLDEELTHRIAQARRITALVARRREERALAGYLRGFDLVAIATRVQNVETNGVADVRAFQQIEVWRDQLIADNAAIVEVVAQLPSVTAAALAPLIANARRERATSKPPGAARALFRYLIHAQKAKAAEALRAEAEAEAEDVSDGYDAGADDPEADSDAE